MWSPSDRLDVIGQLRGLTRIYPKKFDQETVEAYLEVLYFMPPNVIRKGIREMVSVRDKTTFPAPGEIVKFCQDFQPKNQEEDWKKDVQIEIPKEHRGWLTIVGRKDDRGRFRGEAIPYDMRDARLIALGESYRKLVPLGLSPREFSARMADSMIMQGVDPRDVIIQEYRRLSW